MNQEEKDLAVLAYLKGQTPAETVGDDSATSEQLPHDEVDTVLRSLQYNRVERERMRRRHSGPSDKTKYRDVTVKRFEYYIGQRLPGRKPEQIADLAKVWVRLTDYDLGLAQRWWDAGVDAGSPDQLLKAIEAGLQIEDLGRFIHRGRTVAECLQAGNSLRWVMAALGWQTSA